MNEQVILDFLKTHNIPYQLFEHQPVFTVDDVPVIFAVDRVPRVGIEIPRPHYKTLFLKDKNGLFFLVSVIENKRVDLKRLSESLGCGRFSFGSAEELDARLHLTPGSVTPYALVFDVDHTITFVLYEEALAYQWISFHPLRNDMTVVTSVPDFLRCMKEMRHDARVVRISEKEG